MVPLVLEHQSPNALMLEDVKIAGLEDRRNLVFQFWCPSLGHGVLLGWEG